MAGADGLKDQFNAFCKFGAGAAAKTTMTTKNATKCFKDCKLYGKCLTTTDTDIAFSKVKTKGKSEITFDEFKKLLDEVAPKYAKDHKCGDKDAAVCSMQEQICKNGPSTAGTTGVSKTGGVAKMTDTSQYTGAHKERFGADGKGKGIDGRENRTDGSGYVGGYQGAGTYDCKK